MVKLESQKVNSISDTLENFLVELRKQTQKLYPATVNNVATRDGTPEYDDRVEIENIARDASFLVCKNCKNEQIRHRFIKTMPNSLKLKLLEKPVADIIAALCTLVGLQFVIRETCSWDECFEDSFKELGEWYYANGKVFKTVNEVSVSHKEI